MKHPSSALIPYLIAITVATFLARAAEASGTYLCDRDEYVEMFRRLPNHPCGVLGGIVIPMLVVECLVLLRLRTLEEGDRRRCWVLLAWNVPGLVLVVALLVTELAHCFGYR